MEYLSALAKATAEGIDQTTFKALWEEEQNEKRREREERLAIREENERQRQHEIEKLKLQSELAKPASTIDNGGSVNGFIREGAIKVQKLPIFNDQNEDLDSYLKRFERLADTNGWKKENWADRLGALLTGKALDAYSGLSDNDSRDYEKVKGVLLKRYMLTAEGYRKKFRSSRLEKEETYSQLSVRLTRYLDKWIELSKTGRSVEGLIDLLVREQLLQLVEPSLCVYLKERNPESVDEMVEEADLWSEAHTKTGKTMTDVPRRDHKTGKKHCFICGSVTHTSNECARAVTKGQGASSGPPRNKNERNRGDRNLSRGCFICGSPRHIARFCNVKPERTAAVFARPFEAAVDQTSNMEMRPYGSRDAGVTIGHEGHSDTDPVQVPSREKNAGNLSCSRDEKRDSGVTGSHLGHGDSDRVDVPSRGNEVSHSQNEGSDDCDLTASTHSPVVMDDAMGEYLAEGYVGGQKVTIMRDTGCSCVIVKRAIVPDSALTGRERPYVMMDGTKRTSPVARMEVDTPFYKGEVMALVVDNPVVDLIIGNVKGATTVKAAEVCTRAQKMEEETELKSRDDNVIIDEPTVPEISKLSPEDVRLSQKEDVTLKHCWEKVEKEDNPGADSWYKVKKGILHRMKRMRTGRRELIRQVVVPKKFRVEIMKIAHENVFAGHLGIARTQDRIMDSFFWPGIGADVARFCRSCDSCQKTCSKGKVGKAPLVPSPLIDTAFSRVAVDIIGPLSRSEKGNSYILTLVDYATRFPEAKALPKITAEVVSEALMEMFSRLGIPDEVVSDRGSQFTGELMRDVSNLLKTKQLFTTPYHAMANGLCERFNGVLKSMLRRVAHKHPKKWDTYLAPLLFAYRETPQASTGFSPFELVFAHSVKGPLTLLKDVWTGAATPEVRTTYQHVIEMRERLQDAVELANENVRVEQRRQKKYYDRGARQRKFKPGDSVLILLPTDTSKLQMTWKGPYKVEEQKGPVDYIINVRGRRKTYHLNMLKEYRHREKEEEEEEGDEKEEVSASAVITDADDPLEEAPVRLNETVPQLEQTETFRDVNLADDLTTKQRDDISKLLRSYADVFSDVPGKTDVLEHKIELTDTKPIKVKPYNLPQATRETVKEEIDTMLRAGVIEHSDSPYSSPIVLVKKTDESGNVKYRFCNDYRRINAVTQDDLEPMPEIEVIMGKLTGSNFFSKFDLTRGFWQVPINIQSRPMTAFSTPYGHFQYCRVPFGLKNSPAIFNRLMRRVLDGVGPGVEVFVDDVLIHSDTWEEHVGLCDVVLERLRDAGLRAKPTKCFVGLSEVDYLGHVISKGCVKPQDKKLEAIIKCEQPTSKKQVRSFLGLTGYYRKFVANYAAITAPLSDLTKKSKGDKFKWDQPQEKAFQDLKSRLATAPILKMPIWNKEFILQTDASGQGIAACLLQVHDDVRHPIVYVSRKLKLAEAKYSTIERECLAIVFALQKLEHYLYGRSFVIETDHAPLTWLKKNQQQNARVTRWALAMQPFDFRMHNIKGRDALWADALSRLPLNEDTLH